MLIVDSVSKIFGGLQALIDVCFTVPEGLITSIIGPNGAGKTTLFNCISGTEALTKGSIKFKGKEIGGWPAYRIANAGIGRTFQNPQLFRNLHHNPTTRNHNKCPSNNPGPLVRAQPAEHH